MGDRNSSTSAAICRRSLYCFFCIASLLSFLSWFFLLRSTGRPQFIDHAFMPREEFFTKIDTTVNPENPNGYEPNPSSECKNKDSSEVLKVFMYDLPPEFHFGMLDWKPDISGEVWPKIRTTKIPPYPSGLASQHSVEYWLTLDLLFSEFLSGLGNLGSRAAVRVRNSSEADVMFVPFFSSLTYNRHSKVTENEEVNMDKMLQEKLVEYLVAQQEWKMSGGIDHVILAHHPNTLSDARNQLWPAMFILSDFGRYPPNIANVRKDVIAPYKHMVSLYVNDTSTYGSRQTLLYFQGAIYRKDGGYVRQELYYLLRDEKDVHFAFGSVQGDGIENATQGMRSSKFCLNLAGDTPSSNRLFDSIASHCVPVLVSDEIELPYEDVLDYSEFCIFVRTSDAIKKDFLVNLLRGIGQDEWTCMWRRLKQVERHFELQYPSTMDDDAVQMIWKAIARKVPGVRLKVHRLKRFELGGSGKEVDRDKGRTFLVPSNFW